MHLYKFLFNEKHFEMTENHVQSSPTCLPQESHFKELERSTEARLQLPILESPKEGANTLVKV
jgi:hypothetical protein